MVRNRLVVGGFVYDEVPPAVLYLAQLLAERALDDGFRVVIEDEDGERSMVIDFSKSYCWGCGIELQHGGLYCPDCDRAMED